MLIYLWKNGDYELCCDIEAPATSDYVIIQVPDDEDVDNFVEQILMEVNLGDNCNTRTVMH
jgi:hypothetical protein